MSKVKGCKNCGEVLTRNTWGNGQLEELKRYAKRQYCSAPICQEENWKDKREAKIASENRLNRALDCFTLGRCI